MKKMYLLMCLSVLYGIALCASQQTMSQPSSPSAEVDMGSIQSMGSNVSTTSSPIPQLQASDSHEHGTSAHQYIAPQAPHPLRPEILAKMAENLVPQKESGRGSVVSQASSASSVYTVGLGSGPSSQRTGPVSNRSQQSAGETTALFEGVASPNAGTPLLGTIDSQYRAWITWVKPVIFYGMLTLLGLLHGGVNKHLSNGEINKHFYAAPWVEWTTGAVANILAGLVLVVGCKLFKPVDSMGSGVQTWLGYPLMGVLLSVGQMVGESIPLPEETGWRNMAVNVWVIPVATWYLAHGVFRACCFRTPLQTLSRSTSVGAPMSARSEDSASNEL